jgi:hypothetical protein
LRAGPLSHSTVIQFLNDQFVNAWVLRKDLPRLRDAAKDAEQRRLATAIIDARLAGSPVDCMVFSPELEMVACEPVHDLLGRDRPGALDRYRRFLQDALGSSQRREAN